MLKMADEICAKRFVVVDDEGRKRATLGVSADGVGLELAASGSDRPAVAIHVSEHGDVLLTLTRDTQKAELRLGEHLMSLRLEDSSPPTAACSLTIDAAGAWLVSEVEPNLGVRVLCNRDGKGASVWLSEAANDGGETIVRTRYLCADPADDRFSGWQAKQ
jgi:hypothetical protein